MKKYSTLMLITVTGALLASCNGGADSGYGYDECYNEYECGPIYDMAGTSQSTTSAAIQINTAISSAHEVNLVIQSKSPVKNLTLDNLETLPKGWSNIGNSSCSGIDSMHECILTLRYSPTVLDSGDVRLNYSYLTTKNTRQAEHFTLKFASTTTNNVNVVIPPMVETPLNSSKLVTVSFNSDNGKLATNLQVTNGLANLAKTHLGWSAPTSFSCSQVVNGQCILQLSYTPTKVKDNGAIVLDYSYINDQNQTIQAKATVLYRATN